MRFKERLYLPLFLSFIPCLLIFPSNAFNGAKSALVLCFETLIPSLFAFMVCSDIVTAVSYGAKTPKLLSKILCVPSCCEIPILLSFLGGYPVGIKCLSRLYDDGMINEGDARRLSLTLINPSPAFLITAIGKRMLLSIKAGVVMTISVYISNLILSLALLFFKSTYGFSRNNEKPMNDCRFSSLSTLIVGSVTSSSSAMISICMFTVFFGAVAGVFTAFTENEIFGCAIKGIFEVTLGVDSLKNIGASLPFYSAVTAFGGLCVIMQILHFGQSLKIAPLHLIFVRLLSALISFFITKALSVFYAFETPVITNLSAPLKVESNYGFFSSILISAAVAVFLTTLEKKRS